MKRKFRFILATSVCSILFSQYSLATTYCVDPAGVGDTGCDVVKKTIEDINVLDRALLLPGDSVLFKRGEVWRETLVVPSSGTSETNRITFGAYPEPADPTNPGVDNPVISGANDISQLLWHGIMANGGFEDTPIDTACAEQKPYDGIYGWRVNSSTAHDCAVVVEANGNNILRINNLGGNTDITSTVIDMQAGIPYRITGRVKPENGAEVWVFLQTTDTKAYLIPDNQSSENIWVIPSDGKIQPFIKINEGDPNVDAEGWVSFDLAFTGIDSGAISVRLSTRNFEGMSYIDDIRIIDEQTNYWSYSLARNVDTKILIEDGVRLEQGALWDPVLKWHTAGSSSKSRILRYVPPAGATTPVDQGRVIELAERRTGILIKEKDYITVKNITVSGTKHHGGDSLNGGAGILLSSGSSNIRVENIYAINNDNGIRVEGKSTSGNLSNNNVFTDFEVAHSVSQGIALRNHTQNNIIRNCKVHDLGMFASDSFGQDQELISLGGGTGNINGTLVEHCEVYNATLGAVIDAGVGIVAFKSPNTIIRYNYVHDIGRNGIVVAAASDNSEIYYNVVKGTGQNSSAKKGAGIEVGTAGYNIAGVKVYNNTVMDCINNTQIYGGITLKGNYSCYGDACNGNTPIWYVASEITLKNNIVYGCSGKYPMTFYVADIDFNSLYSDNNIFYRDPQQGGGFILFQGDNYADADGSPKYTNWPTFIDYQQDARNISRNLDQNSLGVNPEFVDPTSNNLHLDVNSLAINNAAPMNQLQDIEGNNVGNTPDIGAYEYTDTDGDGIQDYLDDDKDGDGLSNGDEVNIHDTDPLNPDTDNDGLNDGGEVSISSNPLHADSDKDGIRDGDDADPLSIYVPNPEGWNLSTTADYSDPEVADDSFQLSDTVNILVWSNQVDLSRINQSRTEYKLRYLDKWWKITEGDLACSAIENSCAGQLDLSGITISPDTYRLDLRIKDVDGVEYRDIPQIQIQ